MPYGCDPILTSFISIMTSISDCSGEGAKRTHQGLWQMPDVEGRAGPLLKSWTSRLTRRLSAVSQTTWHRLQASGGSSSCYTWPRHSKLGKFSDNIMRESLDYL